MRKAGLVLFGMAVVCLAAGPAVFAPRENADEELKIISPHWDGIRHEFGRAFAEHYFAETNRRIHVEWLDIGATGEIRKYLGERFGQARPEEGVEADILFGGGMDMLPRMADAKYFMPYEPPPEIAAAIPESVNGQELRDKLGRYHAACLSSFGIVYNTKVIEQARLPVPKTWEDLGRKEFQGWVSCGNPAQSGAMHATFEVILQGQGWERGSVSITRLVSNVRAFNEGGASVPRDVSLGQSAAGPCIDFYASAPVRRQGATHLHLVIPSNEAVATPDCIAILRAPPNQKAAQAFVQFVISEKGQKLWYQARGEPDGPKEYDLERLPVMPKIYEMGLKTNTVTNPFKQTGTFRYDSKKASDRWGVMDDIWRATLIDVQDHLWDARKAVVAAGREDDLGVALGEAALSEAVVMDLGKKRLAADQRNALKNKWSAWARRKYNAIEQAAIQNQPVPTLQRAPVEL